MKREKNHIQFLFYERNEKPITVKKKEEKSSLSNKSLLDWRRLCDLYANHGFKRQQRHNHIDRNAIHTIGIAGDDIVSAESGVRALEATKLFIEPGYSHPK